MIAALACGIALGTRSLPPVPAAALADERVLASDPRLAWPAGTTLRIEAQEGELVARFDRPLAPAQIDAFRDAGGTGLRELRWNDDSLVLRAASGWTMTWRQAGASLTVIFTPQPDDEAGGASAADATRDAALAAIEADIAAGYLGQARRAAVALAARHPDDRRAARLLADARAADGDTGGAARGYRALGATDRAARRTLAAAPGTATITATARDGGDLAQVEAAARIDAAVGPRLVAGGGLRRIASRVDTQGGTVRTGQTVIDGSLTAALAESARLQLVASVALDDATRASGGGEGGGDEGGGGVRLTLGSAEAQLRAGVTIHLPDFSTPAQVLAGGTASRALVGVTYRLTPGLIAQADGGWNRYGVSGVAGGSETLGAAVAVDYLIRRQFPTLGLSYRFEAEYLRRSGLLPDGTAVVPLVDRENHTLQALIGGTLGAVQVTGLAGWTVDRFGGDGPTASLGFAVPIADAWRVEGSAGVTSASRPGFGGRQLFGRVQVARSLGDAR